MTKRVWILGAGFSRSLGAPLLGDLLSFRMRSRLLQTGFIKAQKRDDDSNFAEQQLTICQDMVYGLYHHGMGYPEGYAFNTDDRVPRSETGLWQHAEEYLEFLDDCANDPQGVGRLEAIRERYYRASVAGQNGQGYSSNRVSKHMVSDAGTVTPMGLATEARRIIAAEVCQFLQRPLKERKAPYAQWVTRLDSNDTIITFNYDRVICYRPRCLMDPARFPRELCDGEAATALRFPIA